MEYVRVGLGAAEYLAAVAGSGPPVLLLHGFPETHVCWGDRVAPVARRAAHGRPGGPARLRGEQRAARRPGQQGLRRARGIGHRAGGGDVEASATGVSRWSGTIAAPGSPTGWRSTNRGPSRPAGGAQRHTHHRPVRAHERRHVAGLLAVGAARAARADARAAAQAPTPARVTSTTCSPPGPRGSEPRSTPTHRAAYHRGDRPRRNGGRNDVRGLPGELPPRPAPTTSTTGAAGRRIVAPTGSFVTGAEGAPARRRGRRVAGVGGPR